MNAIGVWVAYLLATMRGWTERGERGASLVEYAMLLALIVVVCVAAVTFVGASTVESLSSTGSVLP